MHPILFEIPLPAFGLKSWLLLAVVALGGAALALYGWRRRARELSRAGLLVAGVAALLGWMLRGQSFAVAPIPVYSYGALLCLSLVVGWVLTLGLGESDGLERPVLANAFVVSVFAALAGARLLYIVTNWREFSTLADVLALRRGGFVAYGGFLGGFAGSWLYLRRVGLPLLRWADMVAPSLALGVLLTRLGCYLFGCDFGKPLPAWAPTWLRAVGLFPRWADTPLGAGSPAWLRHVDERGLSPASLSSLPVHATQLYEALVGAALFALLLRVRKVQSFAGQLFLTFTFAYGFARFCVETLRDDPERGLFGPALPAHWYVPLALIVFALAYAVGPSSSIARSRVRQGTRVLALLPSLLAFALLLPRGGAPATEIQFSTSQWISLFTALAAAWAWTRRLTTRAPAQQGVQLQAP
ncbi:MAG TPA: prolipoprotein diacylglyceryl transferase family protein [Polyangiaceae bacterium]|nr:prolipoprotein diacylglyceryl transferase family protein [Polyangiaceae bacterium]